MLVVVLDLVVSYQRLNEWNLDAVRTNQIVVFFTAQQLSSMKEAKTFEYLHSSILQDSIVCHTLLASSLVNYIGQKVKVSLMDKMPRCPITTISYTASNLIMHHCRNYVTG